MACDTKFEKRLIKRGFALIAGVDEVGRGALAGPVVAAAVILNHRDIPQGLNDSKQLSKLQRQRLAAEIKARALAFAIAQVENGEIDRLNILRASLQACLQAVKLLHPFPDHVLIDGNQPIPQLDCPQMSIVKGDSLSASIAAASIIAKVARDTLMKEYDEQFPGYGFARHVGYATREHQQAIRQLGASPIHRLTFHGVGSFQAALPLSLEE
ncbi:MAG: ribonuclease HII [Acidobacteria bacterium]|nr:ribonuclease HII [Acidobacteriota bacterium]